MKHFSAFNLILSIILTLGLSISFQSLMAAWISPTGVPPLNNVSQPVNVGPSFQEKLGDFNVAGGLGVGYLVSLDRVSINTSIGTSELNILDENFLVPASLYIKGSSTVSGLANPEIDLADKDGSHWGIYLNQNDSNSLNFWYSGSNKFNLDVDGNLDLEGKVTSDGKNVCLEDGTGCDGCIVIDYDFSGVMSCPVDYLVVSLMDSSGVLQNPANPPTSGKMICCK